MPVNELNQTPNALRLHIGIFGRRNSGKSSFINALANQETALVSDTAGTTTDPVYQSMELHPIGPCVLIDTAGFDDVGELGQMRVQKSAQVLEKTDLAVLLFTAGQKDCEQEQIWLKKFQQRNIPVLAVINKSDISGEIPALAKTLPFAQISAKEKTGIEQVKQMLSQLAPEEAQNVSITGHLAGEGDHVLLVMPQDIQAPKGRLILPQVQTIRDLLDNKAIISAVTTQQLEHALQLYKKPPKVIITDSQVFDYVYKLCPKETLLTSFSILMARYKGDIDLYLQGVKAVDSLTGSSKVLILEACTHNPLDGDIGRVKIPAMLNKMAPGIQVEIRSGKDIPENLTKYDLVIHCGGCMFNRRQVLSRIERCAMQGAPVTNYGIFIARAKGILDKVTIL